MASEREQAGAVPAPVGGDLPPFESVLIFGMGMMGASLALALRQHPGFRGRVAGVVRSEKSARLIRDRDLAHEVYRLEGDSPAPDGVVPDGAADAAPDGAVPAPDGAVPALKDWPAGLPEPDNFDLIVLGLPVGGAVAMLDRIRAFRGIVTDMSSTGAVARRAEAFGDLRFVGAHPMCGSEDSGPGAAVHGLFKNRLCLLLDRRLRAEPAASATLPPGYGEDLEKIEALWRALGMQTFRVDADRHDEIVGYLSHGPHLIAGALTRWARGSQTVSAALERSPLPITGGGFKDMARIAGSNPEMWYEILHTNRGPVVAGLRAFQEQLGSLIDRLERGAGDQAERDFWLEWFRAARRDRNFLCGYEEDR